MTESAQVFKHVHNLPTYTKVLWDRPMRLTVAIPLIGCSVPTLGLSALLLESGHARTVFLTGSFITAVATGAGALVPRHRPTLGFRVSSWWRAARPKLVSSATDPALAPPN